MDKRLPLLVVLFCLLCGTVLGSDLHKGNIHPNIKLSFAERFRMVAFDNVRSLSDTAHDGNSYTRFRTNLTGQWFPTEGLEFTLRLTNEFRYYFVPENRDFSFHEVFVDQLYVEWNNTVGIPGTLTLGRQNIMLGEGFVVMDGGPLDGSRSIYFNAARFDWKLNQKSKLVLFYTYQPETDDLLPIIHDQDKHMIEQPEEGIGAYFMGELNQVNLDAYAIRKNIRETDGLPTKSSINTVGTRVSLPVAECLSLTGETAYQFGEYGEADRSAIGGYAHLDYRTEWGSYFPESITAGAIYLSGDDPKTGDWEAWDPLFSRWPKWSESYIHTEINENGVAYWTNIISLYGRLQFHITQDMKCHLDYHHLMAPQKCADSLFPGGTGKIRGDLLIAKLTYNINEYLSGHLIWESFEPGSYYFKSADSYSWARVEFMLKL